MTNAEYYFTEENLIKDLKEYFPIDLLTKEERKHALELSKKHGHAKSVKYIKSIRDDFGLKSARIYYDLYINNEE